VPLVAHSQLPAFDRISDEGTSVITSADAAGSASPRLRVGLLNLMPDPALAATERQFLRLVSSAAEHTNIWVYPFTIAAEHRSRDARWHIDHHYARWDTLRADGVDALIVTGANPARNRLALEVFWDDMIDVLDWARDNVHSVLCSCLATHAVLQHEFGVRRSLLPQKRWGVYGHDVLGEHPLVDGLGPVVDAPHSHRYEVTAKQLQESGAHMLMDSEAAGAHMAVSDDDFYIYFQGHPEYDAESLLKEYKREVGRFYRGERDEYPPFPENYFDEPAQDVLAEHQHEIELAKSSGSEEPPFPEDDLVSHHTDTWTEAGRIIYNNWLGSVCESILPARSK
jgi:homoserine O-succinyltransferase